MNVKLVIIPLFLGCLSARAQVNPDSIESLKSQSLEEVTVSAQRVGRTKSSGLGNTELISSKELLRAACCNLGESFTTNPSVDVNYADAATGAQQIKLKSTYSTF